MLAPVCVVGLELLLFQSHVAAYARTTSLNGAHLARWRIPRVRFELSGARPRDETLLAELPAAVRGAAAAWSNTKVACTGTRLGVELTQRRDERAERDGINSIVFHARDFCRSGHYRMGACYDPRIAAITTLYFSESPDAHGELSIEEADIELNAVNFRWSAEPRAVSGDDGTVLDLQSVLVHEFGHALGFAHSCEEVGASQTAAASGVRTCGSPRVSVMVPSADGGVGASGLARTLLADDRSGLCTVYPRRAGGLLPRIGGSPRPASSL